MKRLIIVVALLSVCIVVSSAFASQTRVYTLGEANMFVKDYANIMLFPSTVTQYADHAVLDSKFERDYEGYWYRHFEGGILLGLGTYNVIGFFVDDCARDDMDIPFTPYWAWNKFNLFYGRDLNGLDAGLNFYWLGGSMKLDGAEAPEDNYEQSVRQIGVKVGASKEEILAGDLDVTFWFETTSFTAEEAETTVYEPEGYSSFGLWARHFVPLNDEVTIIPFLRFASIGTGVKYGDNKITDKWTHFQGGVGFNLIPHDEVLVVLRVGAEINNEKLENSVKEEYKWRSIPFYGVGVEADLAHWLTCRFGANKELLTSEWPHINEIGEEDGTYTQSTAPGYFYLGAGLFFGDWIFDVSLSQDFLHYGPYFLSGHEYDGYYEGMGGGMFSRISVTRPIR